MLGNLINLTPLLLSLLMIFEVNGMDSSGAERFNYSKDYTKIRGFPSNGMIYPYTLVGPATHAPVSEVIEKSTLNIKGQIYNISKAMGPEMSYEAKLAERSDSDDADTFSHRDSYSSPYGSGGDGGNNMGDLIDPEDTTPAPITGAIDYVLLPLIFIAISGPIFVVIYIVIASIESKLVPNSQQKRSVHQHTYFDVNAAYEGAKEIFDKTMESKGCREKAACEMGQYGQNIRNGSTSFYDYLESFIKFFVPTTFIEPFRIFSASAKNQLKDCNQFDCIY